MITSFIFALVSILILPATTAMECPELRGGKIPPHCQTPPPLPTKPPTQPPPTPKPNPFLRDLTIYSPSMLVHKSYDGWPRGCADPLVYFVYARTIYGQPGSTVTRNLGRINYGEGKCSGTFIRKTGAWLTDKVPTNKVAVEVYTAIAIEEDWFGDSVINAAIKKQLKTLGEQLKPLEKKEMPEFEEVGKPSSGFLNLGHDFVGANSLILFSGSYMPNQLATCSQKEFPSCFAKDMSKSLWVGKGSNQWRVDVKVKF